MRTVPTKLLAWFICLAVACAATQLPQPPVLADPPVVESGQSAKLAKKEAKARKSAAKGVEDYADWCAKQGAYREARKYYRLAAYLLGDNKSGQKALHKIEGEEDELDEDYAEEQREEFADLVEAGEDLFEFVMDARDDDAEDYAREAGAIWLQYFRDEALLEKHEWQWNESFKMLMPDEDAERYANGEVRYRGEWLNAEELAEENAKHDNLKNAWHLEDGFHYMRSTEPLGSILPLFGHATLHRVHVLAELGCELDLRKPKAQLPLLHTDTREGYQQISDLVSEWQNDAKHPVGGGTAEYVGHTLMELCPVMMCNYAAVGGSEIRRMSELGLQLTIQHEIVHQLLFECRSWSAKKGRSAQGEYGDWLCEGIATIYEHYEWEDGKFVLHFRRNLKTFEDSGNMPTRFSRAVEWLDEFPPLTEFTRMPNREFDAANQLRNYAYACSLSYFLMNHAGSEVRARIDELLCRIHDYDYTADTFKEVMKDEDLEQIEADYREFVKNIELE